MLVGFNQILRKIPSATAIIQEEIHPYTFSHAINNKLKEISDQILESLGKTIGFEEQKL